MAGASSARRWVGNGLGPWREVCPTGSLRTKSPEAAVRVRLQLSISPKRPMSAHLPNGIPFPIVACSAGSSIAGTGHEVDVVGYEGAGCASRATYSSLNMEISQNG